MEDSFRVRVDKTFGSLGTSAPSAGVTPSLWCLTDDEIERREWNRSKDEAEEGDHGVESRPSALGDQLEMDLQELSDNGEEDGEDEEIDGERKKRRWNNSASVGEASADEFLDVQSNIGRDCTLDYEVSFDFDFLLLAFNKRLEAFVVGLDMKEEEDKYDKVAVGMEQTGDRIYMRNVKFATYGIDDNEYGELPTTFQDVVRDPRANHEAAKIRLKEDAEAAGDFDSLQLSDNPMSTEVETEYLKKGELDGDNPKPILKKRENQMDSRSQKRVRFMFDPKSSSETPEEQQPSGASDLTTGPQSREASAVPEQASDLSQYSSGVPDYIRNPSKYTRYTFDSSNDMDDQSNRKAYTDFFNSLREKDTDSSSGGASIEIPKSIVFTPKKKPGYESILKRSESEHNAGGDNVKSRSLSVGIEDDVQDSEISAMEEDEPPLEVVDREHSLQKPGRQYRARISNEEDD